MKYPRVARPQVSSSLEALESRIAPAGVVFLNYENGVLGFTDNPADNEVRVSMVGTNTFRVEGLNSTLLELDGVQQTAFTFEGVLKEVSGVFTGGNDRLELINLTVGKISMEGGGGDDELSLEAVEVSGSVTFQGGDTGNDRMEISGDHNRFVGPVTADLGDGDNEFESVGRYTEFLGAVTVTGLGGVDSVSMESSNTLLAKSLTLNLGDGNNEIEFSGTDFRCLGPLTISHGFHGGTVRVESFVAGLLLVKGPVTIDLGSGDSNVDMKAFVLNFGSTLKVIGGAGDDAVNFTGFGEAKFKGGVEMALGSGENTGTMGSQGILEGGFKYTGGAGSDGVYLNATDGRLAFVDVELGSGENDFQFQGAGWKVAGLAKIVAGAGDDTVTVLGDTVRFQKGLTVDVGDGVNEVNFEARSWQSGAVAVALGSHVGNAEQSLLTVEASEFKVSGAFVVTGGDGAHEVDIETYSFTAKSFTSTLGDGDNELEISGQTVSPGKVLVTGGTGDDRFTFGGGTFASTGVKIELGDGANAVGSEAYRLLVKGNIEVTAGAGKDNLNLGAITLQAKAMTFDLGAGEGDVSFGGTEVQIAGPLTVRSAASPEDVEVSLTSGGSFVSGPIKIETASAGTNTLELTVAGKSKIASVNVSNLAGNQESTLYFTGPAAIGATTFNNQGGNSLVLLRLATGKLGAVTHLGSAGQDTLSIVNQRGEVASIKMLAGAGGATLALQSFGFGRVKGAVEYRTETTAAQTASLQVDGMSIGGALTAVGGAGAESVYLQNTIFANTISIDTGAGTDLVAFNTTADLVKTTFLKAVNVVMGDGDDGLYVGSGLVGGETIFKAKVTFDGGAGAADQSFVDAVVYANTYPTGSPVLTGFESAN